MRAVLAFLLMRSDTYDLQLALGEGKDAGEREREDRRRLNPVEDFPPLDHGIELENAQSANTPVRRESRLYLRAA